MKLKLVIPATIAALLLTSIGRAQDPIFIYDFTSSPFYTDSSGAITNVSSWSAGSVVGGLLSLSVPASGTSTTYFSFDIAEGFALDLTKISFNPDKSGGNMVYSLTSNSNPITADNNSFSASEFSFNSSLSGTDNRFTFSASQGSGQARDFTLDNFALYGTVSAVPEPATLFGVAAFGVASFYFSRRRKQMAQPAA